MTAITLLAAYRTEQHSRMAGTIHAAYRVTAKDEATGLAFFVFEYDKRDVMLERLMAEPVIAAALRDEIGSDGPSALSVFTVDRSLGSLAVLEEANKKATEAIYEYE